MSKKQPMKGVKADPKYPKTWPAYVSIKYDGIRVFMDGFASKTKSLKAVPNLHIRKLLESNPFLADLDLELIMGDPADPLCYNKTYSAVMSHDGEPDIQFYIFDKTDSLTETFDERLARLEAIRKLLPPNAHIVKQTLVHSQEEEDAVYEEVTGAGHEGIMRKLPKSLYKYGRATAKDGALLKRKPEDDFEFEILGCYEAMENTNEAFTDELGETARSTHAEGLVPKGMLGGFYAKAITNGDSASFPIGTEFRCAPGKLTHDQRIKLWQEWLTQPEVMKQRIGKCRHFPIGIVELPRHGRWIGWWDGKAPPPKDDND